MLATSTLSTLTVEDRVRWNSSRLFSKCVVDEDCQNSIFRGRKGLLLLCHDLIYRGSMIQEGSHPYIKVDWSIVAWVRPDRHARSASCRGQAYRDLECYE